MRGHRQRRQKDKSIVNTDKRKRERERDVKCGERQKKEREMDRAGRLWGDESRDKGRVDRQRRQTVEADMGER